MKALFEGRRRRHHAEHVTAAVSGQTLGEHSGAFATAWSRHEMATGFQRVLRAVPLVLRSRRGGGLGAVCRYTQVVLCFVLFARHLRTTC